MSNVLNFFVNAGFSVSSICLCSVILFSYFLKNRAKKLEEKSIYFIIDLCAIILMSVVELIYVHHFIKFGMDSKYAVMLYHLYSITILLTTFFSWVFVLSYRFSLNNQIKEKKNNKYIFYSIIGVIEIIFGILIFIMPVNIHQNYGIYTFDSLPISIILVYVLISTTSFVFFLYYKNKTITTRDLIPSIVSLVFVCLILVYRLISRIDINIETFQLTIFVLGVFFTVENQDFKLIETAKQKQTAAENANDSQQEFLADMSHKIRSPINTILGLSQLILQEEKITKESIHDDAEKIKKASNDLLSLVENINNFSYLLADKSEVKKQAYDVPAALFELNSDIIADNPKNEIAFSYSINSSVPKQ